ncbi:LLM class flavin-dependent oxidoreductase [Streptomyces sp. WMMC500]|uniref:LLM class flavin-dependent oxidoreductase n=1 Tax=Streptomyces sp. WMMC500 TaxID=3015154 RepID=UPI00248BD899|nr:LLM class flavin-dependent oxidoreductase [Streptomyces sp. WMMC500]WBB61320.1 LLM class flavin-dependent oxidoreductase [Streptomyces sp. WMMC500]
MPDYGHDLRFGINLIPSSRDPEATVTLAQLSERAGADLITFQDHPYQPAFLDTWTLLSYVAARTDRVTLAGNVHPLPLRPPALLARGAASLDLLSGGRFELALGAGGFVDAVAALGGPRRSPGEAVEALDEGIRIIRETWDTDARGGIRFDGRHYRVQGAKRGPRPAHEMQIWLGAFKPRMLRLIGRSADGWLPSLPSLDSPGALAEGNKVIDEAAVAAGRAPGDVRRLLNLGQEHPAEQLAEFALSYGTATFLIMTGDPRQIERFAGEVAPAVRALVAEERGAVPEPVREERDVARVRGGGGPHRTAGEEQTSAARPALWDESTRPTVPEARTARPGEDVSAGHHLVEVHDHLRDELERLRELVVQVADGSLTPGAARSHIAAMTLRQSNWSLGAHCAAYCRVLTLHHTAEDRQVFPELRRFDPRLAPVIDRLAEEHRVIDDVLENVDRALVAFVAGPEGAAELRSAVGLLAEALLSHLAYEEGELVAPLGRLMGGG